MSQECIFKSFVPHQMTNIRSIKYSCKINIIQNEISIDQHSDSDIYLLLFSFHRGKIRRNLNAFPSEFNAFMKFLTIPSFMWSGGNKIFSIGTSGISIMLFCRNLNSSRKDQFRSLYLPKRAGKTGIPQAHVTYIFGITRLHTF